MRRKKKPRPNTERGILLSKLDDAIEVGYRAGGRFPTLPSRYRTVLERLTSWERKLGIAQNKVRFYEAKVKYYEKRLG